MSKADISETGTPFILYGELYTTYKEVATEIKRKTNCIVDKKYLSKIGDVVIPTSGETPEEIATATCVMTPNVILAGDLNIFRINDIDGRFFSYVINHKVNKDISRIAQGKSIVHIKGEEISKIQIKYPSDEEQQKILSFIKLLSLKIEKQEQLIDKLKKYKRGSLSALFPKKREITPQYRFAGFTKPWEQRKLGNCAKFNPKSELPETFEYVDLESVVETDIISHRTEIKTSAPSRAQRLAKKGDVFYQTVRPYQKNNCIFEKTENNWVFSTGYAQLRPFNDSYFLLTLLQNDNFVKLVLDKCTGTSYPAINSNDLADIDVSIPIDSKEQQKIGTYFSNLDHLITLHQHKYDTLLSLKNAILQQMFI